jgi:outer membrane protein assembly factor BamB
VLTSNNTLVSFLKFDGHIRWSTTLPSYEDPEQKKDPISWKGPVMVDGKLALVSNTGLLYLVAAETGEIVAKKEVPEGIFTAPVVAGGQLFLMDKGATLYQSN